MPNLRFAAAKERRVAVITGGARGLGRATALRLAEEGRDVVIADLLDDEGAAVVKEIEALGQVAYYLRTDVSDEAAVHALMQTAVTHLGRLDILVCCAGILGWEKPFLEQTAAQFDKVMRINLYGVYYAHQAAIPHMLQGGWGRCVTITSGLSRSSPATSTLYTLSPSRTISRTPRSMSRLESSGSTFGAERRGRARTSGG